MIDTEIDIHCHRNEPAEIIFKCVNILFPFEILFTDLHHIHTPFALGSFRIITAGIQKERKS